MHHQIKEVIKRMRDAAPYQRGDNVVLNLDAGEHTALGTILRFMYYDTRIVELLTEGRKIGFPHNGGIHTFTYITTRGDAVAFLEVLKEEMLARFTKRMSEEERQLVNELAFVAQEVLSS